MPALKRPKPLPKGVPALLVLRPADWDAASELARRLPLCAFRGQCKEEHEPRTSLERLADRLKYNSMQLVALERKMLHEFQRRVDEHLPHPPPEDDRLAWLSIIQHHGGATRLVDFTRSFYVAAFFAIDGADGDSAIWAVNITRLREHAAYVLGRKHPGLPGMRDDTKAATNWILAQENLGRAVIDAEPRKLHTRLAVQQGMFLLPTEPSTSFMDNLSATFDIAHFDMAKAPIQDYKTGKQLFEEALGTYVVKIVLSESIHRAAREALWRMNITAASLFPGLDGLARSLAYFAGQQQPGEPWGKISM